MLSYSAPGKLFISGEWAILEVGNHGLVAAVNNRVHVSLEGTVGYSYNSSRVWCAGSSCEIR